jgi:hypothetical protein
MNGRIVAYKDYVAGWLDTTIHDFLTDVSPSDPSTKYALITCLDSEPNAASLKEKSRELKRLAKRLEVLGNGLLVATEVLVENELRHPIFFGFDEVWFFPQKDIDPKPDLGSLVGPARIDRATLRGLGKWMSKNGCSMALGSGEGLNFVVQARGLAKFLLGYSIEQPEPAPAA